MYKLKFIAPALEPGLAEQARILSDHWELLALWSRKVAESSAEKILRTQPYPLRYEVVAQVMH